MQALLTLFSKSFSPFPHGTCSLSVSNPYLAWDGIYHPICAPLSRNVTLKSCAVYEGLQMTNRTFTFIDALFQETSICANVSNNFTDHNSRLTKVPIWYWAHPCSFATTERILFSFFYLRLLICLNSAGLLIWLQESLEQSTLLRRHGSMSSTESPHRLGLTAGRCLRTEMHSKCQSGRRNNTYNWNNASKHIAKQHRHWNRQALEWTREHGKRSRIIGSRNYAIHRVYHTSLRPSSLFEPRHPSLTTPTMSSRIDAELATMASRGNRVIPNFG